MEAFGWEHPVSEKFAFRTRISRETSFSYDYDELYNLLEYDRDNGFLLWVLGPAVAFDKDSRDCLAAIIDEGFVHGVLAGNALATHDIEAALSSALRSDRTSTQKSTPTWAITGTWTQSTGFGRSAQSKQPSKRESLKTGLWLLW